MNQNQLENISEAVKSISHWTGAEIEEILETLSGRILSEEQIGELEDYLNL